MNPAKFHLMRTHLGLTTQDIAESLGVHLRTVQRWESTHNPPEKAAEWITDKWDRARRDVDDVIAFIDEQQAQQNGPPQALDLTIPRASDSVRPVAAEERTPGEQRALNAMIAFEACETSTDGSGPSEGIGFTVTYRADEEK